MYKYLIIFILIVPLIGINSVEHGSYAGSVGENGYENGATLQFFYYILFVVATIFIFVRYLKGTKIEPIEIDNENQTKKYLSFAVKLIAIHFIFLFIMLFGFGGIYVWLGKVDKGYFRANLGAFGSIAYLMTKTTIPALFAYSTLQYSTIKQNIKIKSIWWINVLMILMIGSTWGFKSTGVVMMLPGLLILFWDVSFWKIFKLFVLITLLFAIFAIWFDSYSEAETSQVFLFLINRVTVLQGDVSWYLWSKFRAGEDFQNYFPTLLAAIGDNNLKLLGYNPKEYYTWMQLHYDWMLTYSVDLPIELNSEGHSIVGSPFSEGLIAGGIAGIYSFAIIAGALIGFIYLKIEKFLIMNKSLAASLFATYFSLNIFPWLSGGAITQLFHISNFVAYTFTILLILLMNFKTIKI
jgi:hypothetical protein